MGYSLHLLRELLFCDQVGLAKVGPPILIVLGRAYQSF